ncbi:MOSC domain-containing protein [Veronia nyctiphanis]|uniref:MOSC domain-containing protein n=1 Tax=Veronia nyctiphanis TaxID=1278244 RepID=A0A4Q0YLF8_9GAMM|nr:MOSC domain-containing protein [Veronia nyctiphanis]RXJ70844.1 MOSC domain-containing protein [Veronia nyctiphanis]
MHIETHTVSVFCGKTTHIHGIDTAIYKEETTEKCYLSLTGLEGDEQADKKHHGGKERALHQYPSEHYRYWAKIHGTPERWKAPGMGENISSMGMTEESVCVGDQYQWGDAIIEVSQPRSPCFKLNKRWNVSEFSVDMQSISRCGWLYRVIKPGYVSHKDGLTLISRPENAMSIKAVCDVFFGDPLNQEGLLQLREQSALSASWMSKVEARLASGTVENWNFRLLGHA